MFVNRVLIMSHLTFNVYFKFYLNVCVEVPLFYITNRLVFKYENKIYVYI